MMYDHNNIVKEESGQHSFTWITVRSSCRLEKQPGVCIHLDIRPLL